MKMKKLPSEANSRKGDRPREGRLGESCEPMDKNRIEGRHGAIELAQHTEIVWYARGGKCGGSAAEQRAITWGDLVRRQAGEKSAEAIVVEETSRGRKSTAKLRTGGLTR